MYCRPAGTPREASGAGARTLLVRSYSSSGSAYLQRCTILRGVIYPTYEIVTVGYRGNAAKLRILIEGIADFD